MTDEELYAELRGAAQTLSQARREAARHLTPEVRDETPDWLLERLDAALRAVEAAAAGVGRFIREERAGPAPVLDYDAED